MKTKLLNIYKNDFLRHNAIFFVGSMAVAVLNYVYHPIISRLLSVEEFGELQAYLSLIVQIGVISGVFGRIILNIKTNISDTDDGQVVVSQLYSLSTIVTALIAATLIIFSPYIGAFFNLPGTIGLLLTAAILLISIPLTFAKSELQGVKRFATLSVADLLTAVGKLVFALICIYLGGQALGALFGLLIATIATLIFVYPYTKHTIHLRNLARPGLSPTIVTELKYGGLIFVAMSFVTFLYTCDVLIVRYLFDAETAGLYAGITTIARIIVFASGSVAGVAIAHVKLRNTRADNHAVMNKSLLLVAIISGGALVLFSLFPSLVIHFLIGDRFLPMAYLLPLLSLLMALVAFTNLFVMYFMALRRFILIPVLAFGTLTIVILTVLFYNSVTAVVWNLNAGVLLSLLVLVFLYRREPHTVQK